MVGFGSRAGDLRDIQRRFFSLPTLVSLALAGAFLAFVITRFDVDLGDTWDQVKGSNIWLLAAAVAVHYTTFIFRGARWRLLLQNTQERGAPLPGVLYCSQLVLLGWFVNAVAWLRLGDAYRAYVYREEQDASFSRTIGTILAERILDGVMVLVLVVLAVPFLVRSGGGAAWTVLGVAGVAVALLAGVVAVMVWARERALSKLPNWMAERYSRFHQGTLGSFQRIAPVTLLGLLAWMAEVARLYLVVKALDLDLGFSLVIVLAMANSLLSLVPTPGGFGAVESGVAGLAVRLSRLSSSVALALVLVDRAITYLSIIIVGALVFLGRQVMRRSRAVERAVGSGRVEEL
jgi:uncharacterized protein (TIRG00374 family)